MLTCDILWCWLLFFIYLHLSMFFIFLMSRLHLISRLLYHVTGTPPWLLRPVKVDLRPRLLSIAFSFSSTASATVLSGHFLPTGVFYLTLLPDIFGTTCFYQGFPGSRQLFLESFRASYWSSKHRPSPSVCLIHSNPQSFIHLKFVFINVNIAKVLLVMKTLIRSAATLFSNHENIKQQPN